VSPLRGFLAFGVRFLGLTPQAIACRPSGADILWFFQHISHFRFQTAQLQKLKPDQGSTNLFQDIERQAEPDLLNTVNGIECLIGQSGRCIRRARFPSRECPWRDSTCVHLAIPVSGVNVAVMPVIWLCNFRRTLIDQAVWILADQVHCDADLL
jgi:hypothetical protein